MRGREGRFGVTYPRTGEGIVRSLLGHKTLISTPLLGLSVLLIALSSVLAVGAANHSKDEADHRASQADAVTTCRSRLGAAVTDATTSYLFATGQLVGAQGQLLVLLAVGGDASQALAAITAGHVAQDDAQAVLNGATDARVEFEHHPSGSCPPPIPVTQRTVPTTAVPSPPQASTPKVPSRRVPSTTTTTARSTAAPQPPPPSPPTTRPAPPSTVLPGQLCGLLPSMSIPCL